MPEKILIPVGTIFGRWTVLSEVPTPKGKTNRKLLVQCSCEDHTIREVLIHALKSNQSLSCGCWRSELISKAVSKHGMYNAPGYSTVNGINNRCYNSSNKQYNYYGGRGIIVCERWRYDNPKRFENFLADMNKKPTKDYSIDRIDVNGNYEPSNCRWATATEQHNNTRTNHLVTYNGKTQTIAEWELESSFRPHLIRDRIGMGWDMDRAITEPAKIGKNQYGDKHMTYNGKTQSLAAWNRELGFTSSVVHSRLRRGWTPEKIVNTPLTTRTKQNDNKEK